MSLTTAAAERWSVLFEELERLGVAEVDGVRGVVLEPTTALC